MITVHTSRTKLAANGVSLYIAVFPPVPTGCPSQWKSENIPHPPKSQRAGRKTSLATTNPSAKTASVTRDALARSTGIGCRLGSPPPRSPEAGPALLPSTSAIFLNSGPAAPWLVSSSYWKLAVRRLMSLCGLACRKRATRCGVWALKQETWWG